MRISDESTLQWHVDMQRFLPQEVKLTCLSPLSCYLLVASTLFLDPDADLLLLEVASDVIDWSLLVPSRRDSSDPWLPDASPTGAEQARVMREPISFVRDLRVDCFISSIQR